MADNQEIYYITEDNFYAFLTSVSKKADVYLPVKEEIGTLSYRKFDIEYKGKYYVDQIRPSEPLKGFLTCARERVDILPTSESRIQIIVGVKNCDITSLDIQDFVFKQTEPQDPFYVKKRENTIIISCDCNLLWENCFCVALDISPYPEKGFDINLSKDGEDFVVEIGSDRGRDLVEDNKALFSKASPAQLENRLKNRNIFKDRLRQEVRQKGIPDRESIIGSVKRKFNDTQFWSEFASTCVECGGCNHSCPACHCFFLSNQQKDDLKARYKSWDACLYNRFARVAGGANPRRYLYERLRNRFDKKFEFFQNILGIFGCTGCGRCIEVCPGKIDIREVLRKAIA